MLIEKLASRLKNSRYAIAFTGAGMSTESGVPDFRTPGTGIWSNLDPALLHIQVLKRNPEKYYQNFKLFAAMGEGTKPNAGHFALAHLEKLGLLKKVVTQNVDSLHTSAGSKDVLEVHGNLRECSCMACGKKYPYQLLGDYLAKNDFRPLSPCCKRLIRPSIVNFGDSLPESFFDFMSHELPKVDFCLVLGTSLAVYPAAQIPQVVPHIAVVNKTATPQDSRAETVIHASIGSTLEKLIATL